MDFVNRGLEWLESGKDIRLGEWSAKDVEYINQYLPISAKPVVSARAFMHARGLCTYVYIYIYIYGVCVCACVAIQQWLPQISDAAIKCDLYSATTGVPSEHERKGLPAQEK